MGNPIYFILSAIFAVALVVYFVFWMRTNRARKAQDAADGVVLVMPTSIGHLRLTPSTIIEGYKDARVHPLAGVEAGVEDAGTVSRRFTVTRMATLGVAASALPKRIDDREVYLTIEGPATVIVRSVGLKKNPNASGAAREFAARVNQSAIALTTQ